MRIAMFIITVVIATLQFVAKDAMAGEEIYRWVDENGVVHFGDQAPANTAVDEIVIQQSVSPMTPPPSESAPANADQPSAPQPSIAQQQRNERAKKREEMEERKKEIAEGCKQRRELVAKLEPSPRVMVTMEDGTVTRMDDSVRLEALNEAQTYIAKNCDN